MKENISLFIESLNKILIGKRDRIELITAAILSGGNILLEDMPGVGKTIISKSIASLIMDDDTKKPVKFSRIQATPDLLPYDITGVDLYNQDLKDFVFKPGPVFADILLTDELNRTTPKVQSALLEAMAEKQVTVGRKTYKLSELFFVIATQNPVESEGTYPLPAAQLDRFAICMTIGYPDLDHEQEILRSGGSEKRLLTLLPVISKSELIELRQAVMKVTVDDKIIEAISRIAKKTRELKEVKLGLSTRALLMMKGMLCSYAFLKDRTFVNDQDLIDLAPFVWSHRLIVNNPQIKADDIINRITRDEVKKIV